MTLFNGKVAFSDESRFTIEPTDLRTRVCRNQGERYRASNLIPTFKSDHQSISVSAAFSVNERTPLVNSDGKMNKKLQKTQQEHGHYLLKRIMDFIFQQDGHGRQRAKFSRIFLEENAVEFLFWPAQSSKMTPIENA